MAPSELQREALQLLAQAGVDTLEIEHALLVYATTPNTTETVNRTLASMVTDACVKGRVGPEDMGSAQDRVNAMANFCCHNAMQQSLNGTE